MLRRVSSSAFVCLSCRVRLAKQSPSLPRRFTVKSSPDQNPTGLENQRFDPSTSPHNADTTSVQDLSDTKSARREKRPFRYAGKVHKRRGERLKEGSARLSVDTLGKPAEVIILRDLEPHEDDSVGLHESAKEDHTATEVGLSSQQILDSLSEEKKTQTLEEALRQIESLRPTHTGTHDAESLMIAPKKLAQVKSHLLRDFTVAQLKAYHRAPAQSSVEQQTDHRPHTRNSASAFEVTAWRPEVALATDNTPLQQWRPWTKIRSQKKRLVSQIMRGSWRLLSTDEAEERGQLEIHDLTTIQYQLLVDGASPTLQQIATARLVTAETQPQQGVIRITGTKNQSSSAINDIRHFLKQVHKKTLDISSLLPHPTILKTPNAGSRDVLSEFSSSLTAIGSFTHTTIQMTPVEGQKHQVEIHGVHQSDLDEAIRMLLGLINHIEHCSTPLVPYKVSKPDRTKSRAPYCALSSQGVLPLFLRNRHLLRLNAAIPRCTPIPGQHPEPMNHLPHLNELVLNPVAVSDETFENLGKDSNPFRCKPTQQAEESNLKPYAELSVNFGTLVAEHDFNAPTVTGQQSFTTPRIFLDVLPNLPATVSSIQGFGERPRLAKLMFHLRPYSNSLVQNYHLPELFVEFRVGALYGNAHNAELLQIKWRHRHVAMNVELSSSPADLRVSKSEFLVADQAAANRVVSSELIEWIEATKRSIENSGPIKPPPRVTTKIPPDLFYPVIQSAQTKQTTKSKGKKNTKKAKAAEETAMKAAAAAAEVPVEYFYVQVEHQEMTDAPFGAFRLVQTNRDGGRLGGRSSSLSLLVPESMEDSYIQDWRNTSLRLMDSAQRVLQLLQHQFHREPRFKQRLPGASTLSSPAGVADIKGEYRNSAEQTHQNNISTSSEDNDHQYSLDNAVESTASADSAESLHEIAVLPEEDDQPRFAASGSG